MMLVLKVLGIVCWLADVGELIYLINVGWSHAGIDWHGMPTIVWLSSVLGLILVGSAVLGWFGFVKSAVLVAATPGILGIGTLAVVFAMYFFFGGNH